MTTQWHEGLLALPSAFKKSVFSVSTKTPSSFNLVLFQPVSFINVACLAPGGILACDLYYKQIFCKVYSAEVWSLINLVRKHYVQPLPNGIPPYQGLCDAGATPSSSMTVEGAIYWMEGGERSLLLLLPTPICLTPAMLLHPDGSRWCNCLFFLKFQIHVLILSPTCSPSPQGRSWLLHVLTAPQHPLFVFPSL